MLFIQTYHTLYDVYIRFILDLLYNKHCTSETHSLLLRRKTMRERKPIVNPLKNRFHFLKAGFGYNNPPSRKTVDCSEKDVLQ